MGLFKKKNAFVVADRIDILPESFFRTAKYEYCLGMKVSALLTEFAFAESWKATEKLKPKKCEQVEFVHKESGKKLWFYLVNRSTAKCLYRDAELRGISVTYNYDSFDRTALQFCHRLSNCGTYLNGCGTAVEVRTLLGAPARSVAEQEYVEQIKVKSTTPRIEEIEQEFDDQYYVLKNKVYDTYNENHYIEVGEMSIWRNQCVAIQVQYSYLAPHTIENITIETTC